MVLVIDDVLIPFVVLHHLSLCLCLRLLIILVLVLKGLNVLLKVILLFERHISIGSLLFKHDLFIDLGQLFFVPDQVTGFIERTNR